MSRLNIPSGKRLNISAGKRYNIPSIGSSSSSSSSFTSLSSSSTSLSSSFSLSSSSSLFSSSSSLSAIYLLDTYASKAGYSVRKLSSTATNCMRIRRQSDNAELDIGFVDDWLDESAINAFCTSTNCYVAVWYDQSANGYDLIMTTASKQPRIFVFGSGVPSENGRPRLSYDGNDDMLENASLTLSQPFQNHSVFKPDVVNTSQDIYNDRTGTDSYFQLQSTSWQLRSGANLFDFVTPQIKQYQTSTLHNTTSSYIRLDGSETASGNAGSNNIVGLTVGNNSSNGRQFEGGMQELIFRETDDVSDVLAIELNQVTGFGI